MLGQELDWSILDTRLAAFLPSLLQTALFFGGNEEPGWRGFALPRLQDRFSPVRSTLVLGAVWAPWHAPILFASDDASHGLGTGGVLVLAALALLSIVGSLGRPGRCASDSSVRMHLVGMRTMARNRIHVGTGPARAGRRTTVPPKRDQLEFTQIGLLRGDQLRRKAAAVLAAT